MRFPDTLQGKSNPIVPLGGRFARPRPIVAVAVVGPTATRSMDTLLDTGADDTVFPESLAAQLGVDLSNAPTGTLEGVGQALGVLRYAEVTLRISDGYEYREWRGWVGFTAVRLRYALAGFAGFLQYFTATFHGDLQVADLTVNALYPGT